MTHVLERILNDAKNADQSGQRFLAVFDLDSTLFDLRERQRKIMLGFAQSAEARAKFARECSLLEKIIIEDVDIICTHGTFSIEKFDELLETYHLDEREVYIFVDSDASGMELRKQLKQELPHAEHIYVAEKFKEVARTPEHVLATQLLKKHIEIDIRWLREVR